MKLIPSTTGGKVALSVAIASLLVVAALITGLGPSEDSGLMVKLFLLFLGAVIAVQVIPGMLLFGAMVKALSTLTRKEAVKHNKLER